MNNLLPNIFYSSIYEIDYKKLKKKGIKCILFDIDNTCIPYKEKNPSNELIELFKNLIKEKFKVIIFTNAGIKRLNEIKKYNLDIDYKCNSLKPLTINYKKILKKYNYKKNEVCIVGDQLYTDILGGNRTGIYTILVKPLSNNDLPFTKILRLLEKNKLKQFKKKGILNIE